MTFLIHSIINSLNFFSFLPSAWYSREFKSSSDSLFLVNRCIVGDDCQQTVSINAGQIHLKDIESNSSIDQPFVRYNIYLSSRLFIIHNYLIIHL